MHPDPPPDRAVNGPLHHVTLAPLNEHVSHCAADAAGDDDPEKAQEMITDAARATERLVKS